MDQAVLYRQDFNITAGDFASAGEASSTIKNKLKQLGVLIETVRHVAVASYEAEINMVIHSEGGVMSLIVSPGRITIICKDNGPGIKDVDLAMKEGYSTASESARMMGFGAGMGLPNMRRCTDEFSIESEFGVGTTVTMYFNLD